MPEKNPTWLAGVEGPAARVVESNAKSIRVAAGPGTGKSFALMRRVARLLAEGVDAARILVVTFTRTAAKDLVDSLRGLGVEGAQDVRAGTLHGYCFSVLSREAALVATGRVPRPLLKHEIRAMQADLHHQHGFGVRQSEGLLAAFNAAWARMQSDEPGWPREAREAEFHRALIGWLRFHRGMLIGELVPEMRTYLRDNPTASELRAFDHVLIDEYQDLNRADQDLLTMLAAHGHQLVIGDEDQSIYTKMRYAQPEGIRTFGADQEDFEDIPLAECRRCPSSVVEAANHLIAHNEDREQRELTPFPGNEAGDLEIVQWATMDEEAKGLAETIASAVRDGIAPGRVLVLAPRRVLGYAVRDELRSRGIAAHSYFSEEALDTTEAQERFTLLNLLARPDDLVALRTWLGLGQSGWAAAGYSRVQTYSRDHGVPVAEALDRLRSGALRLPYTAGIVARYEALQARRAGLSGMDLAALVDDLFPDGAEDLALARSVALACMEELGETGDVGRLFDGIRTGITQPELPATGDFVRIMSLHKSKGLTADLVIIAGAVEGWLPTVESGSSTEAEEIREQRRLFYVAITRPRRRVIISSFTRIGLPDAYRMRVRIARKTRWGAVCVASRFIRELGPTAPQTRPGAQEHQGSDSPREAAAGEVLSVVLPVDAAEHGQKR